ncbi:MAG: ABC transporter substrate-binding protein [Pseudomonadota bacterium]
MRATLLCLALTAAMALATMPARAGDPDAARATAEDLVEGAHAALTGDTGEAALTALRETIDDAFAFDVWERFLLGSNADQLTEAEREEFRALLPGFLADLYRKQFGKGLEARPEIRGVEPVRRDFMVRAAIPRANGKTLPVDWRVRDFGERGHLVIDVMVGGTSFLILKRDEFRAILKDGGADALLDFMRANSV